MKYFLIRLDLLDSGRPESSHFVCSVAARIDVRSVARHAATHGLPIATVAADKPHVMRFMEEQQMVASSGHIVDEFVTLETRLKNPVPVGAVASRICIVRHLTQHGWRRNKKNESASLELKVFSSNEAAPLEYFLLLRDQANILASYDRAFKFRHGQSKAYYDALTAAFQHSPAAPCLAVRKRLPRLSFLRVFPVSPRPM